MEINFQKNSFKRRQSLAVLAAPPGSIVINLSGGQGAKPNRLPSPLLHFIQHLPTPWGVTPKTAAGGSRVRGRSPRSNPPSLGRGQGVGQFR